MTETKYNCTCCGRPVDEIEALEAEKIMLETRLLKSKTILEVINLVLKISLAGLAVVYLPEILEAIK